MTPVAASLSPASLIIVSRHRPGGLMRALLAVSQMDHPCFEVIVVADPAAAAQVRAAGWRVKLAVFDAANIAQARNIGLSLASAPVVAFLDDDAVPEPTWLRRLTAPFAVERVMQAGGYVRGRSGLAWQWRAMRVDVRGFDTPFDAPDQTSLHPGTAQSAVKTQGTNCAFRRDALLAIGGFDPAFAFYLDEADVNLRLAPLGLTAVVPGAVVHHGFAASSRRRADRVPTDLTQIGASVTAFVARHAPGDRAALTRHRADQRARLIRHLISGALEPSDVRRMMDSYEKGATQALPPARLFRLAASPLPLLPLPGTGPRPGSLLFGTPADLAGLRAVATDAVSAQQIVTLICLSRGLRPQHHVFTDQGWWEQTGGRFGRSERGLTRFDWRPARLRLADERSRLSALRPVDGATTPSD